MTAETSVQVFQQENAEYVLMKPPRERDDCSLFCVVPFMERKLLCCHFILDFIYKSIRNMFFK